MENKGIPNFRHTKKVSRECKYSPSCFTCPLADCRAGGDATLVNALPWELEPKKDVRNYGENTKQSHASLHDGEKRRDKRKHGYDCDGAH
jgi:hypothetical protein